MKESFAENVVADSIPIPGDVPKNIKEMRRS
jgi:hypothetical protein